jgi:hypothetical protein
VFYEDHGFKHDRLVFIDLAFVPRLVLLLLNYKLAFGDHLVLWCDQMEGAVDEPK